MVEFQKEVTTLTYAPSIYLKYSEIIKETTKVIGKYKDTEYTVNKTERFISDETSSLL